ncbi:sporulation histidine kinase inhibitor Sda [Halalkalibacter alkalisediminis]|uniref:Sporulation histidine kinase inhibitor Sda n=1 Tax=Halalkalibacter alkalisediminis TaxID=935616 RepID=A0ABV6NCF8_9BACI|nr:sporulation histidine kinase inhibitor Sda [Halalkalibacter alkalisediminis]
MYRLSDEILLESFEKAFELELNDDFLLLLSQEVGRRGIQDLLKFDYSKCQKKEDK